MTIVRDRHPSPYADNSLLARTAPFLARTPITVYAGSDSPRSRFVRRAGHALAGVALFVAGVVTAGIIWR